MTLENAALLVSLLANIALVVNNFFSANKSRAETKKTQSETKKIDDDLDCNDVERAEKLIKIAMDLISPLQQQVDQQGKEIASLKLDNKQKDIEIADLKEKIKQNNEEIRLMKQEINDRDQRIVELERLNTGYENRISELENERVRSSGE